MALLNDDKKRANRKHEKNEAEDLAKIWAQIQFALSWPFPMTIDMMPLKF